MQHLFRSLYRLSYVALMLLIATGPLSVVAESEDVVELQWEDLMPKDWNPRNPLDKLSNRLNELTDNSPEANEIMAEMRKIWDNAPVVEELNNQQVRLPGYVVPLDFEGTEVSEFLLVPYFGACIHVPPPPANQIVYVKTENKLQIEGMFDPVWVTGKLKTVRASSELAQSGYSMDASAVTPYEE